ncbi:MAG: 1-acyl-sn-glycerol-3-phosphate acyltransferase [Deltaproteobacteria bacterium]|nr:1-acyl-sn-glycerol-3-phosphate acyltransferase [Deltaproteobacteria bacterium]
MKSASDARNNLFYLPQGRAEGSAEERRLEKLVRDMAKRLASLEKELGRHLKVMERELSSKKSRKNGTQEKIYKELKNLQSSVEPAMQEIVEKLKSTVEAEKAEPGRGVFGALKGLIPGLDFVARHLPFSQEKQALEEEYDAFGRDPAFEQTLKPFFDFMYYKYWRVETHGLENLPSAGRALLVGNHSGTLPWDGSMIRLAVTNDHPAGRDVRFLVEDFVYYLPFVGTFMYRIGGVRASQENAERLLNTDHLVAVFPEGVKGLGKYFSQRYHLQRFGRGGFIKLAIRTDSPIIPVAVIGAEEIHPLLFKSSLLAKPLGIPYVPFTPTLPLLGPLGFIPLPSKWSIYFGKPIDLSVYGKEVLDDELEIHRLSERVRQTIQNLVTDALKRRRSVWRG